MKLLALWIHSGNTLIFSCVTHQGSFQRFWSCFFFSTNLRHFSETLSVCQLNYFRGGRSRWAWNLRISGVDRLHIGLEGFGSILTFEFGYITDGDVKSHSSPFHPVPSWKNYSFKIVILFRRILIVDKQNPHLYSKTTGLQIIKKWVDITSDF